MDEGEGGGREGGGEEGGEGRVRGRVRVEQVLVTVDDVAIGFREVGEGRPKSVSGFGGLRKLLTGRFRRLTN
jgi:hypothetical protein